MAELQNLVTAEGDISVLDRVGGRIFITLSDGVNPIDLTGEDVYFEIGDIAILTTDSVDGKYFDLIPTDLDRIIARDWDKFAVINRTDPTSEQVLWEGYIFVRSLD